MIAEPYTHYLIVMSGTRPIEDVAKDLGKAGLMNVGILEQLHCISGKANPDNVNAMLQVPGVMAIEPDMPVQLEPED